MSDLPGNWKRDPLGAAYLYAEVFELFVERGKHHYHVRMRVGGDMREISDDYRTEQEAVLAATTYGQSLVETIRRRVTL